MEDRPWERSWSGIDTGADWSARPADGEMTNTEAHLPDAAARALGWMSTDETEMVMDGYAAAVDHGQGTAALSGQNGAQWADAQDEGHGAEPMAAPEDTDSGEGTATAGRQGGMDLHQVSFVPGENGGIVRAELNCGQQQIAAAWAGDQMESLRDGVLRRLVPTVDQVTVRHVADGWKLEIGLTLGESIVTGTWSVGDAASEVALPLEVLQAEIRREFARTLQAALEWADVNGQEGSERTVG